MHTGAQISTQGPTLIGLHVRVIYWLRVPRYRNASRHERIQKRPTGMRGTPRTHFCNHQLISKRSVRIELHCTLLAMGAALSHIQDT